MLCSKKKTLYTSSTIQKKRSKVITSLDKQIFLKQQQKKFFVVIYNEHEKYEDDSNTVTDTTVAIFSNPKDTNDEMKRIMIKRIVQYCMDFKTLNEDILKFKCIQNFEQILNKNKEGYDDNNKNNVNVKDIEKTAIIDCENYLSVFDFKIIKSMSDIVAEQYSCNPKYCISSKELELGKIINIQ